MNYKANGVVALLIFVLGVLVLVFDNPTINRAVLISCGVAFFVPGLLSVLGAFFRGRRKTSALRAEAAATEAGNKKKAAAAKEKARQLPSGFSRAISLICGFGGIGLGVCIWLMPDVFQPVIVWLFGALLLIGGVYQLALMASRNRETGFPGWLIAGPLITVAAGVVLIFVDYFHHYGEGFENNEFWMMVVTGVCMIIFGVVGMVMAYMVWSHRHAESKAAKAAAKAEKEGATKGAEAKADAEPADVKVGEGKVDGKLAAALKLSDNDTADTAADTAADTDKSPAKPE